MIEFRRLGPDDVDALIKFGVKQDEFQCIEKIDFWKQEELHEWFLRESDICIGLTENKKLIGYILSYSNLAINKISLENIFISSKQRRKGFGKLLLEFAINCYQKTYPNQFSKLRFVALVQESNTESINLLKSCGFSIGVSMRWAQK